MVRLPVIISQRLPDPFIPLRNQRSLHLEREEIHLTPTLLNCLPKTLHIHSEWANRPKLHPEANQFKGKFLCTTETGWVNRSWLRSHMLQSLGLFLLMQQALTALDPPLTGHKEEHKNGKEVIVHERRQKRITLFHHLWQQTDIQDHTRGLGTQLYVKTEVICWLLHQGEVNAHCENIGNV